MELIILGETHSESYNNTEQRLLVVIQSYKRVLRLLVRLEKEEMKSGSIKVCKGLLDTVK